MVGRSNIIENRRDIIKGRSLITIAIALLLLSSDTLVKEESKMMGITIKNGSLLRTSRVSTNVNSKQYFVLITIYSNPVNF